MEKAPRSSAKEMADIGEHTAIELGMELEDETYKTTDLIPEHPDDHPELEPSVQHEAMEAPYSVHASRRHGKHPKSPLVRRDKGDPYSRSPSSCNRHLWRSRARAGVSSNKPQALVDAEMEMGLAQGSRIAEKAMRAVRQANAQVCHANLEVRMHELISFYAEFHATYIHR